MEGLAGIEEKSKKPTKDSRSIDGKNTCVKRCQ
jgi:hypothetical protein